MLEFSRSATLPLPLGATKAPVECGTAGNCIKTHGTASNTLFLLVSCWPVSATSLSCQPLTTADQQASEHRRG